eukprot:GGOE01036182.1.p1 GENE.GGOE01036182.1~~GGOE01036182.1.p1  ORF type:complete len:259 (+),score=82.92 GGOE01036182.1:89-778(+)
MEEAEQLQQDLVRRIEARRQQNQVMEEQLTANDNENRDVYDRLVMQEEENDRLRREIEAERTDRQALFERLEVLNAENPLQQEGMGQEVMVEFPNLHPTGSSTASALSSAPLLSAAPTPQASPLGAFPTAGTGARRVVGVEYREIGSARLPLAASLPHAHIAAAPAPMATGSGAGRVLGIEYRDLGSASATRLPLGVSVPSSSVPHGFRYNEAPYQPQGSSVARALASF